jgi:CspA family cold shock protein
MPDAVGASGLPRLRTPSTSKKAWRRHGDALRERKAKVAVGTVKWFNRTKGYGFIGPSAGDKDVFVHISAVERAGLATLNEGQQVEYELEKGNNGKISAVNLKLV